MKRLLLFLLVGASARGELIPAARLTNWGPNTHVGVPGGIEQYADGVPTTGRNTSAMLNVKSSPYFAAGTAGTTTGNMTVSTDTITVASPTGFTVGNVVNVGMAQVETLTITGGAINTQDIYININGVQRTIALTAGDTITQVATKVRNTVFHSYTNGGTGATVTYTHLSYGAPGGGTFNGAATGATGFFVTTVPGNQVVTNATITAVTGNVLTLNTTASATVTGAVVFHNDGIAIQNAINACGSGCNGVYMPAGTYRIDSTLALGPAFSNRTLRGAGPELTLIEAFTGTAIAVGAEGNFQVPLTSSFFPGPPCLVTAGLTKGSTQITLDHIDFTRSDGGTGFFVGQLIDLLVQNDLTIPVSSVAEYDVFTNQALMRQIVRVTAKNDTAKTVDIWPPLHQAYSGQVRVMYAQAGNQADKIGIEGLTTNSEKFMSWSAYSGINFGNTYACWLKDCTIMRAKNYNVKFEKTLNNEIRHCTIKESQLSGTNGSCLLHNFGHGSLIENNIIRTAWPILEINFSSSGNVFAYNYFGNGLLDTNHAPWNNFNLYEGNVGGYYMSDGYFGGEGNLTVFRNYISDNTFGSLVCCGNVHLRRFTRNASVIGNFILVGTSIADDGLPNLGNGDFDGTASFSTGDPWRDWAMSGTLTARLNDDDFTDGVCNNTPAFASAGANFVPEDVAFDNGAGGWYGGTIITGPNIPSTPSTYIIALIDESHVTLSAPTTGGSTSSATFHLSAVHRGGTGEITLNSGLLDTSQWHPFRIVWGASKEFDKGMLANSNVGLVVQMSYYGVGGVLPPVGTTLYVGPGAYWTGSSPLSSYQEKDLDVAATTIKKGNRFLVDGSFQSLGGDTLPASLFRTAAPSWWADRPWPPFDPVTPIAPNTVFIPAGFRFVNGFDPDEDPVAPENTAIPTVGGSATVGGTMTFARGTWTGVPSPTLTSILSLCDSGGGSCVDIPGTTGLSYVPVSGDFGSTVIIKVHGVNPSGFDDANSLPSAVIGAATPTPTPTPTATPTVTPTPTPGEGPVLYLMRP